MGIVSRAKTRGGYGKLLRRSQKILGERNWTVLTIPVLSGEAGVEGPLNRILRQFSGAEINLGSIGRQATSLSNVPSQPRRMEQKLSCFGKGKDLQRF